MRWLHDQGLAVRFCTTTDSIAPAALADRLARCGFEAWSPRSRWPSAGWVRVAGAVLAVAADGGASCWAGSWSGRMRRPPMGWSPTPARGRATTTWTRRCGPCGAGLVATQVNRIAVRDDGEHLDPGGWVRLLEDATGSSARVLGKPFARVLHRTA